MELEERLRNLTIDKLAVLKVLTFFGYRGGRIWEFQELARMFGASDLEDLDDFIEMFEYRRDGEVDRYVRLKPELLREIREFLRSLPDQYHELMKASGFHGHLCPGLSLGVRAAIELRKLMGVERARDDELIAIVETDSCFADGFQYVLGTTLGKGALRILNLGKNAASLFDRRTKRALRIRLNPESLSRMFHLRRLGRESLIDYHMRAPREELFVVEEVEIEEPEPARVYPSILCDSCGEVVSQGNVEVVNGRKLCPNCRGVERYYRVLRRI